MAIIVPGDSSSGLGTTDVLIAGEGLKGEVYDRVVGNGFNTLTSGQMRSATAGLVAGTVVTSLVVVSSNAGVGMTHTWLLLYDRNQNLLAQTADSPTSLQTTGPVTLALTAPLTISATAVYYLAVLATTGTSMPSLIAAAGNPSGSMAAIGTGVRRSGAQAGLAAPPNPSVLADAAFAVWVGAL